MNSWFQKIAQFPLLRLGVILLCGDLLMVILHVALGGKWYLFNLDWEHNIPTGYQVLKAIIFGCVALFNSFYLLKNRKPDVFIWLLVGALSLAIGIDEWFQLHEQVPELIDEINQNIDLSSESISAFFGFSFSQWPLFVLPFALPLAILIGFLFYKRLFAESPRAAYGSLLGLAIFGLNPLIELLGTIQNIPWILYYLTSLLEEFSELVALSIIVLSFLQLSIKTQLPAMHWYANTLLDRWLKRRFARYE